MTSPWLKKSLKLTGLKCPQIERFSWTRVNDFSMVDEILKFTGLNCLQIEGFSRIRVNDLTMVEENFEIHRYEMAPD